MQLLQDMQPKSVINIPQPLVISTTKKRVNPRTQVSTIANLYVPRSKILEGSITKAETSDEITYYLHARWRPPSWGTYLPLAQTADVAIKYDKIYK